MAENPAKKQIPPPWRIQQRYPFILQFGITSKCNLRCKHCYDDTEEHVHMPFNQCVEVLDKFFTFCQQWNRYPMVWLTGGEPTIHPKFWDILDYIVDRMDQPDDCYAAILSNGINLDADFVQKLEENPLLIYVQISVDGARAETHEAIRGKGTFEKALHALKLLRPTGIQTHIHFVVHKDNYEDGFEMTDVARRLGVDVLTVTRLVPWGRGKELIEKMLTPEQVYTLYKKLSDDFDAIMESTHPPRPYIARDRCDWPLIYSDPKNPEALKKNGHRCGAARSYINIMENGDVYPCRRMPIKVGNILKEEFIDIWQHPLMWKLRQKHQFMQGKCQNCYFCAVTPDVCSGGASCIAYAYYDDPFQPDPQCWFNPNESPAGV